MKPVLVELLGLSKDAIHMHVGFACFVITIFVWKKNVSSFKVLIPGLIVSLLMEMMDMRDDNNLGRSPNVVASLHDLINTNFIPFVICLLARMKRLRADYQTPGRKPFSVS